ncbi:hypothetical protein JVU11DRAFT_3215 [Chiua virens]|nr:hypothetical protein JVU11DRAFT_3215 [Chiua virens]
MGFFSSRTSEGTKIVEDDKSVVQVIRSRFYGKYKGKQRETCPNIPSPQLLHVGGKSRRSTDRTSLVSQPNPHSPLRPPEPSPRPPPRAHTDAITSTLAQRLNELAAANAEGLLNDEEYRLLRQNIFERLASGTAAAVPTENPVIPLGSHSRSFRESSQLSVATLEPYTPHQFQVKPRRTPSVRSKSSVSSAVSNLFKRGSSRRISAISTQESAISETSSIFSLGSPTSKRRAIPTDMRNTSPALRLESRHNHSGMSTQSTAEHRLLGSASFHSISRGMRRLGNVTPPSSFPSRIPDIKQSPPILTSDASPDDDKVKSSQEIRLDIEAIEAEGHRLLDAFNGLELSALTRSQHAPGHPLLPRSPSISGMSRKNGGEYSDSFLMAGSSASGQGTPYHGSDADGVSLRSATSYGTNVSQPRSHRPNASLRMAGALAANRKRSMSSLSSRARIPPSSAAQVLVHPRLGELGSVSSVNLVRLQGSMSMSTMDEDPEMSAIESELLDIRRRRQEVTARYQDRLEYLRAQLKGAELREKLLRK